LVVCTFVQIPTITAQEAAVGTRDVATTKTWLDADGKPLPFRTPGEIEDFLRNAKIVNKKDIGKGVNRSLKVTLEESGVRAHAIFREVRIRERDKRVGDRMYLTFVDDAIYECAAYRLSNLLGLDMVPPAVQRTLGQTQGSLQLWLEDALDEDSEDFNPPDPSKWVQQVWTMYLFDNLIFNVDRNSGNLIANKDYRLFLIDHTRGFQYTEDVMDPSVLNRINRRVWDRIMALTEGELRKVLSDYLEGGQFASLIKRREALKNHVQKLMDERGPEAIFYQPGF
jgi:hypothetical protein